MNLKQTGRYDYVYDLFKKSLKALAWLQIKGNDNFDYNLLPYLKRIWQTSHIKRSCYILNIIFLIRLKFLMIKKNLIDDFEALSNYLTHVEYKYFMFRDFQSRNIYVKMTKYIL